MPFSANFVDELKALILLACDKVEPPGGLDHDEALFGPNARLALDSLDALQISVAIHKRYAIRLADSKETRRAMTSLATLVQYLSALRA